jgi:hypothetical protein
MDIVHDTAFLSLKHPYSMILDVVTPTAPSAAMVIATNIVVQWIQVD